MDNEIPLKKKLELGDHKRILSLRYFNGEYDKEEEINKVGKKWKRINQVDWNTKHFATPLDTLFKDNILEKMHLKLPIPEVIPRKEKTKFWIM